MLQNIKRISFSEDQSDRAVTIAQLQDNAACGNVKLSYSITRFGWSWTPVNPFTYILWQALSKMIDGTGLIIDTMLLKGEIQENLEAIELRAEGAVQNTIYFAPIAKSNFTGTTLKTWRKNHGGYEETLDSTISEFTTRTVRGIHKYKKVIIVFIDEESSINSFIQIRIAAVLSRFINPNDTPSAENTLFKDISRHFLEKPNNNLELKQIIADYCSEQPEYKIDLAKALTNLITKLRNKRLEQYEQTITSCRENIRYSLEEISRYSSQLENALYIYNSIKNNENDPLEKNINEAFELLDRSTRVTEKGLDGYTLWYIVRNPLEINDKYEWERISKNLFPYEETRELINKVLIDEEYEIWTEATIGLDLSTHNVTRYKNEDTAVGENCLPHPHIQGYRCFGMHAQIIANSLAENDIISAIEQTIEAATGLNWSDGPVINKFSDYIDRYADKPVFRDPKTDTWFSLNDYKERKNNENITRTTETNN